MTQLLTTPPSFVLCFLLSLEMYNSFCWVFKSHFPEKNLFSIQKIQEQMFLFLVQPIDNSKTTTDELKMKCELTESTSKINVMKSNDDEAVKSIVFLNDLMKTSCCFGTKRIYETSTCFLTCHRWYSNKAQQEHHILSMTVMRL